MTSCKVQKSDEELTDEALLRQYEEIMQSQKTPQKKKQKIIYENPADEVLDDLNQHESDMNDMLKYLSEVEDLVKNGQDLNSIQEMMDVTKDTMSQHFEAYNKFKGQIDLINQQADQAISSLNFYDTERSTSEIAIPSSLKMGKK